jgi:hypothetical protein
LKNKKPQRIGGPFRREGGSDRTEAG